jgi:hypothetical protein
LLYAAGWEGENAQGWLERVDLAPYNKMPVFDWLVGRVTPCAPFFISRNTGAHGVTRPIGIGFLSKAGQCGAANYFSK